MSNPYTFHVLAVVSEADWHTAILWDRHTMLVYRHECTTGYNGAIAAAFSLDAALRMIAERWGENRAVRVFWLVPAPTDEAMQEER